jgi:RNA polymerase sigma factor (sigma-70 family)
MRHLFGAQNCLDNTDRDLVERFAIHREDAAFAALIRRHGPMVLSVCRRVSRTLEDADDAFQATFLVLVRKADTIRKKESIGSWLHGVAYRVAREARIRSSRQGTRPTAENLDHDDPSDLAARRELRSVLDQELNRLPEKYRSPLVLHYLEGKTKEETALQLGCSEGTVSGRLARARDLLRRRLTYRGLAIPSTFMVASLSDGEVSASLAPMLADSTLKLAMDSARGESGNAAATSSRLAETVLRGMFLGKMKRVFGMILCFGVLATGLGIVVQQAWSGRESGSVPAAHQGSADGQVAVSDHDKPELLFQKMENALVRAKSMECSFKVEAGDALFWNGTLFLGEENRARLEINEASAGKAMRVRIVSDGARMSYQDNGMKQPKIEQTAKDLNRDILTWMARTGLFLPQCPLPEVKANDAKDRFSVARFKLGEQEAVDGLETRRIEYQLTVKGQKDPMSVTVWIDLKANLPVKRRIVASVAEALVFVETYDKVTIDAKVDSGKFELPK